MYLGYKINIIGKVVDKNNKIAYYVDNNYIRYTYAELRYIVNNNKLPEKFKYMRDGFEYIDTNMRMQSNGVLRCKSGRLQSKSLIDKSILVIVEDSGSGFIFYREMIERSYVNVKFDIISSNGNKGLLKAYKENMEQYKHIIVISDNKLTDDMYMQNMLDLKISAQDNRYADTFLFKPLSVEEVILSSDSLVCKLNNKYSILWGDIRNYYKTGNKYYSFQTDYIYKGVHIENMEHFVFHALTTLSLDTYTKDRISKCMLNKCCNDYIVVRKPSKLEVHPRIKSCKRARPRSGFDMFRDNSTFEGMQNIIDNILGINNDRLKNWSQDSKDELYFKIRRGDT